MFWDNISKNLLVKIFTGGLVVVFFFTLGNLFYQNLQEEGESVKTERLEAYLQNSSQLISSELSRIFQQYQIDAYAAIDKKMKSLERKGHQNLLAWNEGGRRYSFFTKTQVEDIRFITGGLYLDTIVPGGGGFSYILKFPAETLNKKFYITVTTPGDTDGYLLGELNINDLLKVMQHNTPGILLDSYLVTNLNKIVLANDRTVLGQDLSDVLVRKYQFYNDKTLIDSTGKSYSKAETGNRVVIHGFSRKPMIAGERIFSIVLVGRDVSDELSVSEFSKNKILFFIVVLFFICVVSVFMLMRRRTGVSQFLMAIVNQLPIAIFLKDEAGIPIIWNRRMEESLGIDYESLKKQLAGSSGKRKSSFGRKTRLIDWLKEASSTFSDRIENSSYARDKNDKKYVLSTASGQKVLKSNIHDLTDRNGRVLGAVEFVHDVSREERITEKLNHSEKQHKRVTDIISEGVWLQNNETGHFILSSRAKALLGFNDDELESSLDSWWSRVHKDDYSRVLRAQRMPTSATPEFTVEYRIRHKDGHYLWLFTKGVSFWQEERLMQTIVCHKDITVHKQQQKALDVLYRISTASYLNRGLGRYLESVHAAIASYTGLESFFVSVWREEINTFEFLYFRDEQAGDQVDRYPAQTDQVQEIPGLNGHVMRRGTVQLFKRTDEEMQSCLGFVPEQWLGVPLMLDRQPAGVIAVQSYDESYRGFDENAIQLLEVVAEQVARAIERHKVHEHLYHQATHDNLTGLLNREHFLDWGSKIVMSNKRDNRRHALFMLDLNRFKQINDSLGHHVGDQVLISASKVIKSQLREVDTLARLGGDEFAILLENAGSPAEVITVAKRIINSLKSGIDIDGRHLVIGTSIGIVVEIEQYESINDAMRDADIAMYEAKYKSSQHFRVFNQRLHTRVQRNIEIEQVLTNEFKADEFIVHYQPIIDIVEQQVAGFEALVRWRNPRLGYLPPNIFLPVAEETGMIARIDEVVLEQACQDLTHWHQQTGLAKDLTVSVNISQSELIDVYLPQKIINCIKKYNITTSSLLIELTESAFIRNLQMAKKLLDELRQGGVGVRIDDFGTGYSSLAHLADLPFDALKIDRSFIDRAEQTEQGLTVLKTLVKMSKSLRMPVVAEGVETVKQLQLIDTLGCRYGQGYYFAKPMRQDAVVEYLSNFSMEKKEL